MIDSDSNILKMVDRACQIMDYLYKQEQAASISVLSKELGLPKANVFRILYTLQVNGLVEKTADSALYQLGNKLIQYGEKVRHDFSLVNACKSEMSELAKEIGETINLGIVYNNNILTIHSAEGERSSLVSKLIPIAEPYCSSMGKLHLAELDDETLKTYYDQSLEKRTVNTITSMEDFIDQRDIIRSTGIAFDQEEYEYGLSCMAVPLRNNSGLIIAMLSISGPTTRLEFKGMDTIIEKLKAFATTLEDNAAIQSYKLETI